MHFKWLTVDLDVPSQRRLTPCPLRTVVWGPPPSHLDPTSYLAFWISAAEEKDVARLRLEGSSLEKKGSQKSGSQTAAISYLVASISEAACWAPRRPKSLTQHS